MIPMSNNWSFGKEDIDELLFMLQVIKEKYFLKLIIIKQYLSIRMHQIHSVDHLEFVQCLHLVLVESQL